MADASDTNNFERLTVRIPGALVDFVETRKNEAPFYGNFSSYVRSLILRDQAERQTPAETAAEKTNPA
ncbi:MAG: hypothetical protein KGL39_22965 [Patescibacteria group bacterium]|nr:hypothetical protein [Patescibacteria group bacterium]